jgi:hypothetical protein
MASVHYKMYLLNKAMTRNKQICALLALGAVIWCGTASFQFVWDDNSYIVNNTAIRSPKAIPSFFTDRSTMAMPGAGAEASVFRPVRNVSYCVDYRIAGLRPRWWHIHNVALHLINAVLVLLVARLLVPGRYGALAAAGLFLVHPVQSEVVAWVKCRDDLLSTIFCLCLLLLWIAWRKAGTRMSVPKILSLCGLYLLACLSKDQAIILPLLLVAYEFLVHGPSPARANNHAAWEKPSVWEQTMHARAMPAALALCATGAAYLVWRTMVLHGVAQASYPGGDFSHTMLSMTKVLVSYARLLVFPMHQLADYSGFVPVTSWLDWPQVALCAIMALVFLCAVLFAGRKFLLEKTGLAWTFLALIPVLNIVPMMQFMAERFLYLPMIGFSLLCGSLVDRMEHRTLGLALVLSAAVITAGGVLSLNRAQVWKNEQTLYAATAADSHYRAIRPYYNYVSSLIDSAHYGEALVHARRLWTQTRGNAVVPQGRKADVARMFGIAQFNAGDPDSGIALLQAATALDPANHANSIYLGLAFREKNRLDSARAYQRAKRRWPGPRFPATPSQPSTRQY